MPADDQKIELPGVGGILVYRDSSDANVFSCSSTGVAVARDGGDCLKPDEWISPLSARKQGGQDDLRQ